MMCFVNMQIKSAYLGSIGNIGDIGDIGNIGNIGLLRPKENASEVPLRNLAGLTGYKEKADSESLPNLPLVEGSDELSNRR